MELKDLFRYQGMFDCSILQVVYLNTEEPSEGHELILTRLPKEMSGIGGICRACRSRVSRCPRSRIQLRSDIHPKQLTASLDNGGYRNKVVTEWMHRSVQWLLLLEQW